MSSGFSYPQPIFTSPTYNPAFYLKLDPSGFLTYDYAQTLYLSKNDYRLTYLSGITPGAASQGIALVPDTNKDISGLGAISCSSLTVNGVAVGTLPNYLTGITPGSASNNKALVLGASGEIGTISSLTATSITGTLQTAAQPNITSLGTLSSLTATSITGTLQTAAQPNITSVGALTSLSVSGDLTTGGIINGFLGYGNQSAITTVGVLTELAIGGATDSAYLRILGNGLDYLDGSYTRMCRFVGSNATLVEFQIEVHNGTRSTSTNPAWIGTKTNNDLRFGVNDATQMIITTAGRVGIGTTAPSVPLHVPSSVSYTFGSGSSTVYRLRTVSGVTESALGPIVYSVSAIFGGYLLCDAMAVTSDRRLKRNIQPAPLDRIKILYDQCEVKLYDWIESENRPGQEVGLIAQDLVQAHLTDLTSIFYRDDIEEGEDSSLEPAKQQLNVDYSRISAYNMKMIQHLMSEIEDLKNRLANIES